MLTPKAIASRLQNVAINLHGFLGAQLTLNDYLVLTAVAIAETTDSLRPLATGPELPPPESREIPDLCMAIVSALAEPYNDAFARGGFSADGPHGAPGIPNEVRAVFSRAASRRILALSPEGELQVARTALTVADDLIFHSLLGLRFHRLDRVALLTSRVDVVIRQNPGYLLALPKEDQELIISTRVKTIPEDPDYIPFAVRGLSREHAKAHEILLRTAVDLNIATATADLLWLAAVACLRRHDRGDSRAFRDIYRALGNHHDFYVSDVVASIPQAHFRSFDTLPWTFEALLQMIASGSCEVARYGARQYVLRSPKPNTRTFLVTLPAYFAFSSQYGADRYAEYETDPLLFILKYPNERRESVWLASMGELHGRLSEIEQLGWVHRYLGSNAILRGGNYEDWLRAVVAGSVAFFIKFQLGPASAGREAIEAFLNESLVAAIMRIFGKRSRAG